MAEESFELPPPIIEEVSGPCPVCGEELDSIHHAFCQSCLQPFHMRMTENVEAKDCGVVWLDDETCSMVFACNLCYAQYLQRNPLSFPGVPTQIQTQQEPR